MKEMNGIVTVSARSRKRAAKAAAELAAKTGLVSSEPVPQVPQVPASTATVDLGTMTPEQARELLEQRKAKLAAGARKAWESRRANGFDAKAAAQKAWVSRRAKDAALQALAAQAK